MRRLGQQLFTELSLMGHGNVIPRALEILKGEVAAVGEDITHPRAVQTWSDYFSALREIMRTPTIYLVISHEDARLGFTIDTREK